MTTADQRAQTCPTCDADQSTAPGRYCDQPCHADVLLELVNKGDE